MEQFNQIAFQVTYVRPVSIIFDSSKQYDSRPLVKFNIFISLWKQYFCINFLWNTNLSGYQEKELDDVPCFNKNHYNLIKVWSWKTVAPDPGGFTAIILCIGWNNLYWWQLWWWNSTIVERTLQQITLLATLPCD